MGQFPFSQGGSGMAQCLKLCQTIPAMAERLFVILKYQNKIPTMASCAKCARKFFTPSDRWRDGRDAEEYLRDKFAQHECTKELEQ